MSLPYNLLHLRKSQEGMNNNYKSDVEGYFFYIEGCR